MRALLDVNLLIALLDEEHIHHQTARSWLVDNIGSGWASCPVTQNGCLRIMSQPSYPNGVSVSEAARLVSMATGTHHHRFWADQISLLDRDRFDLTRIHGPKQLTDAYLLGLAVENGGCFATLDQRISTSSVVGASSEHLVIL